MGFYEQISKYYDYIFPAGEQQIEFITNTVGSPPKSLLDVACGSGGYSVALSKAGYSVSAIDLDDKMVEMAIAKKQKEGLDINVVACDMLDISKKFGESSFDLVFCIGNSIVHLGSKEDILDALKQMRYSLKPGGKLIIQIINFDRVFKYSISSLPSIENDEIGLKFVRNYNYDEKKGLIKFNTLLTVNEPTGKEEFENSIELLPLMSDNMMELIKKAGFRNVDFFGDFENSKYSVDSYMLVVKGNA